MPQDFDEINRVTEAVIGSAYEVQNILGTGFLEKVYENALRKELQLRSLQVLQQHSIEVDYKGENVGEYKADLVVEDKVIVELKASKSVDENDMAQCLNYLKATGFSVCLLLNFGSPKVFVKRIIDTKTE